jgi:predicted permease
LRRTPAFLTGIFLTLAIGVGANGAVFSLLQAVLLQPLPYRDPDRIVMVWNASNRPTDWRRGTTTARITAWYDQSRDLFSDLAAFKLWMGNLEAQIDLVTPSGAERLRAGLVTPNFFTTLGVTAINGRVFTADDENAGARDLAVLSHGLWQRAFGGDPAVVGQSVTFITGRSQRGPRPLTIVGVLPAAFRFTYPRETELWVLQPWSEIRNDPSQGRAITHNGAVARLLPSITFEQAQARLASVGMRPDEAALPAEQRSITRLERTADWVTGETRPSLWLLAGVASLLLIISCATVATALFIRQMARRRELSVRAALGASRAQLVRQAVTEGTLLVVLGSAAGMGLSIVLHPVLRALVPPIVPRGDEIGLSLPVVFFAMAVTAVTVLLSVVAPAWRAGCTDVSGTLGRGAGTSSSDRTTTRWRSGLLAIESSMAAALLVSAALLLTSFWRLHRVDLGFDGDQVLTVEMRLLDVRYRQPGALAAFQADLLDRVRAVPGVLEAGLTSAVPFRGVDFMMMLDRPEQPNRRHPANGRYVDATFFSVMKIPLKRGRLISDADTAASPKVMLVSETFAKKVFGGADPIGRLIDSDEPTAVVGVVGDVRYVGRDREAAPAVYYPRAQHPIELMCVVARTDPAAGDLGPAVRRAIAALDPSIPAMNITTIDRIVSESVADKRFTVTAITTFAVVALLLTVVGITAVVGRAVIERRHELAIRTALGATRSQLTRLVMRQGMLPAAAGALLGLAGAFTAATLLQRFLFEVTPREPLIYFGVACVIVAVAVLASVLPGRRAANTAPASLLRAE